MDQWRLCRSVATRSRWEARVNLHKTHVNTIAVDDGAVERGVHTQRVLFSLTNNLHTAPGAPHPHQRSRHHDLLDPNMAQELSEVAFRHIGGEVRYASDRLRWHCVECG